MTQQPNALKLADELDESALEQQPVQEPAACRFCHSKKGSWTWQCYKCGEIDDVQKPAPPQQQAKPVQEPVAWDKPSASFDDWWDGDRRRDNANPFTTDSFAYWAFEGWQAARLKEKNA